MRFYCRKLLLRVDSVYDRALLWMVSCCMVSWKMQMDLIWCSWNVHQSNLGEEKLLKNIAGWDSSQFYCISTSGNVNVESRTYVFAKHSLGNYDMHHWLSSATLDRNKETESWIKLKKKRWGWMNRKHLTSGGKDKSGAQGSLKREDNHRNIFIDSKSACYNR